MLRAAEPTRQARMVGAEAHSATRSAPRPRACRRFVALQAFRAVLPERAARAIRSRRCDALMAHWRLVTPRLVRRVRAAGGELYVWTVDELPRLRALEALGVTGVITNDPRLFAALGT